jgi:flagellar motor switch protein FliG
MNASPESLRKAAILVACLDPQTVDVLLDQMPAEEAALVRRMVVDLEEIDPQEQNDVIDEFFRIGPFGETMPSSSSGGVELDEGLARRIAAGRTLPELPAHRDEPPFRFLHEATSEKLSPLLAGEHPQTIALVLSHLPPKRAIGVVASLPSSLQADVIRRLVDLDEADPEILREVERGLESRIWEQIRHERRRAAGLAAVTSILDAAEPRLKDTILSNLAQHDQHLAGKFHRRTLEFADFERLNHAALAVILEAADPEIAMLALAGAPATLVARILGQLPPKAAKQLRRSLDHLGPTRLSDVEDAQQHLAQLALRLEMDGRLDLPRNINMSFAA